MQNSPSVPLVTLAFGLLALSGSAQSVLEKIDLKPAVPEDSNPQGANLPGETHLRGGMPELAGEFYFSADNDALGRELYKSNGLLGGTQLVNDFVPGPADGKIGEMVAVGGLMYLAAASPTGGVELWSTGGTPGTTLLVADLNPGSDSSTPRWLTAVGTKLYFVADTPATGRELVVYNTVTGAPPQVLDVYPGPGDGEIQGLIAHPSGVGVLFEARSTNEGLEMWTSDGTIERTVIVADLNPGTDSGSFNGPVAFGGGVLFSGVSPAGGEEPYFTDGTAAGTFLLADIETGTGSSLPEFFPKSEAAGVMYFLARNQATGRELYQTDGTAAGTFLVTDAVPGPGSSFLTPVGRAGGKLVLIGAVDYGSIGAEYYTLEPSGAVLLKDMAPGSALSVPNSSSILDSLSLGTNLLIGAGNSNGGSALWITDGTPAGTTVVSPMVETLLTSPRCLTAVSPTAAIFRGSDSLVGSELFRTEGTPATTTSLLDINPGTKNLSSSPSDLARGNGQDLYLVLVGFPSYHCYSLDQAGTLTPLATSYSTFRSLNVWSGDQAHFLFPSLVHSGIFSPSVLVQTDGTTAGTSAVVDAAGAPILFRSLLESDGEQTLFVGFNSASGAELWTTDGTAAGTHLVLDINPGAGTGVQNSSGSPKLLNGEFFFEGDDGVSGGALWKTDGTAANTVLVKDILPGGSDNFDPQFVHGDRLFFQASDPVNGFELWITDGTTAGTTLLKDLTPGVSDTYATDFVEYDGKLYFLAGEEHWKERDLWTTDGTTAGTRRVADVAATSGQSPNALVSAGGLLFFESFHFFTGHELWIFDGTSATRISDLAPGAESIELRELTACGNRVYFTATTPATSRELFVSDGTTAGTHIVMDLIPGPGTSRPESLVLSRGDLYFIATGNDYDRELYRLTDPGAHVLDLGFGGSGARLTSEPPVIGGTFTVTLEDAPAGDIGALLLSGPVDANAAFASFGNASWLDPLNFKILTIQTAPTWSYTAFVPNAPALIGHKVNVQAWFLDPVTSAATTSNGLRLVLGE